MVDQPVILVVTENERVSDALVADLHRRFGADYRVMSAESGETVVAMAAQVHSGGGRVALFIADQSMVALPAAEVLTRVREVAPMAKRVLLVDRGDWSAAHPVGVGDGVGSGRLPPVQPVGPPGAGPVSRGQ